LDTKTKTKKESQNSEGSTKPKVDKKPVSNINEMVTAIFKAVSSMKPVGQLDAKGLNEAKQVEVWIMQLQNNQVKAKVNA